MEIESTPLELPRELILLAFLWLVAAWLLSIGIRPPIHPTPASYEPAVRMLFFMLMLGTIVGWPLYRLSQAASPWPIRQTLLDFIVLLAMIQVVIWPLRLITTWSRERVAAMDGTFGAWLLLTGAIVAAALASEHRAARLLGMLFCILLCLAGPLLAWLGVVLGTEVSELAMTSPLTTVHALGQMGSSRIGGPFWQWMILTAVAGALAWLAPAILARRSGLRIARSQ